MKYLNSILPETKDDETIQDFLQQLKEESPDPENLEKAFAHRREQLKKTQIDLDDSQIQQIQELLDTSDEKENILMELIDQNINLTNTKLKEVEVLTQYTDILLGMKHRIFHG